MLLWKPSSDVFVSAPSAWEIAIKASLGKQTIPPDVATWLPAQPATSRLTPLALTVSHAAAVERLPAHHADPFDRLLIAQAMDEEMVILTSDRVFKKYPVQLVWCGK